MLCCVTFRSLCVIFCSCEVTARNRQAVKARVQKLLGKKQEKKEEKAQEEKEEVEGNPQRDSQLREAAFKGTLCRTLKQGKMVYEECTEEECPGNAHGDGLEECACQKIKDILPVTVLVRPACQPRNLCRLWALHQKTRVCHI